MVVILPISVVNESLFDSLVQSSSERVFFVKGLGNFLILKHLKTAQ